MRVRTSFALLLTWLCLTANAQERRSSLTGDIRHLPHWHSQLLSNNRDVVVYLPPGYDSDKDRRYPVLYMADGQNLFDGMTSFIPNQEWRCDETAEALIRAKAIPPMIIVGVNNTGSTRADEYLPTRAKISENGPIGGGNAEMYARMLLTELKPEVDRTFRTRRDRESTGVGGSSFGGILSLYLAVHHSDQISKALVVSPSIWWDQRVMLKEISSLEHKLPVKIWLDVGTKESATAEKDAEDAALALEKKGWKAGKDLMFFVDKDGRHNEQAWSQRFPLMLLFIYRS